MGFSALQIILVFVWVFIVAIDQFDFLESLYQPIVSGAVIGAILGDLPTGLIVGGTYQLMTIGNMPVGGAQPPNAVIGGVMATVFAMKFRPKKRREKQSSNDAELKQLEALEKKEGKSKLDGD